VTDDDLQSRLDRLGVLLDREGMALDERVARSVEEDPAHIVPSQPIRHQRRKPSKGLVLAALMVVLALVVAGSWVTWERESGDTSPHVETPATRRGDDTTNHGSTDASGCVDRQRSSTASQSGTSRASFAIRNFQVQVNSCMTKVFFLAGPGTWHIAYRSNKDRSDPSIIMEVRLAGAHAAREAPFPPDDANYGSPSVVSRITRVRHRNDGDDQGTTWSIRLDRRRAYTAGVETIGESQGFAINIAAPQSAPLRCQMPAQHLAFTVPDRWFYDMTWGCSMLNPGPIVVTPPQGSNISTRVMASPSQGVDFINGTETGTSLTSLNGRTAVINTIESHQTNKHEYQIVLTWDDGGHVSFMGITPLAGSAAPSRDVSSDRLLVQQGVQAIANSATHVP
jgi:hypothetical protein